MIDAYASRLLILLVILVAGCSDAHSPTSQEVRATCPTPVVVPITTWGSEAEIEHGIDSWATEIRLIDPTITSPVGLPEDVFIVYAFADLLTSDLPNSAYSQEWELIERRHLASVLSNRSEALALSDYQGALDHLHRLFDERLAILYEREDLASAVETDNFGDMQFFVASLLLSAVSAVCDGGSGLVLFVASTVVQVVDAQRDSEVHSQAAEAIRTRAKEIQEDWLLQEAHVNDMMARIHQGQTPLERQRAPSSGILMDNPFVICSRKVDSHVNASSLPHQSDVADQLHAASLVPDHVDYRPWRERFVRQACSTSRLAAQHFAMEYGGVTGGRAAEIGVALCRSYLTRNDDPFGSIRFDLAVCLSKTGDHERALRVAAPLADETVAGEWARSDCVYVYYIAALCSLTARFDDSLRWLEEALKMGNSFLVRTCRSDPKFAQLRQNRPESFASLLTVDTQVSVKTYTFWKSDVELVNRSAFPISDITMRPIVVLRDGVRLEVGEPLSAKKIGPGESHIWRDVFPTLNQADIASVELSHIQCNEM